MAVLNDYECDMHGAFEAFERRCPYGCSRKFVKLVFLKPVGTRSGSTKWTDNELKQMASAHGLTDIKSGDQENSCMTKLGRTGKDSNWIDVPHASPGFSQRGEKAPVFDIKTLTNDPGAVPAIPASEFKNIPRQPTHIYRSNDGFSGKQ